MRRCLTRLVAIVIDPIPPYTRLIAIASVLSVFLLNRWYRHTVVLKEQEEQQQEEVEVVDEAWTAAKGNEDASEDAGDGDDVVLTPPQTKNEQKRGKHYSAHEHNSKLTSGHKRLIRFD